MSVQDLASLNKAENLQELYGGSIMLRMAGWSYLFQDLILEFALHIQD
jgi:hypothetical protein